MINPINKLRDLLPEKERFENSLIRSQWINIICQWTDLKPS